MVALAASHVSLYKGLGIYPKHPRCRQLGWATLPQMALMGSQTNISPNEPQRLIPFTPIKRQNPGVVLYDLG